MTTDPEEIQNQTTDKEKDIEVGVETEIERDLQKEVEIEIKEVVPKVEGGVGLERGVDPKIAIQDQKILESLEIIGVSLKSIEVGLGVVRETIDGRDGAPEVDPIVGVEVIQKRGNIEELRAKRRAVTINSFVLNI